MLRAGLTVAAKSCSTPQQKLGMQLLQPTHAGRTTVDDSRYRHWLAALDDARCSHRDAAEQAKSLSDELPQDNPMWIVLRRSARASRKNIIDINYALTQANMLTKLGDEGA